MKQNRKTIIIILALMMMVSSAGCAGLSEGVKYKRERKREQNEKKK